MIRILRGAPFQFHLGWTRPRYISHLTGLRKDKDPADSGHGARVKVIKKPGGVKRRRRLSSNVILVSSSSRMEISRRDVSLPLT